MKLRFTPYWANRIYAERKIKRPEGKQPGLRVERVIPIKVFSEGADLEIEKAKEKNIKLSREEAVMKAIDKKFKKLCLGKCSDDDAKEVIRLDAQRNVNSPEGKQPGLRVGDVIVPIQFISATADLEIERAKEKDKKLFRREAVRIALQKRLKRFGSEKYALSVLDNALRRDRAYKKKYPA